ncbi:MAG: hypothetical protein KDB00_19075, partial [Planctomycetales bacterium]|nr:hypothetical protein [Planctomycetales bacterium]
RSLSQAIFAPGGQYDVSIASGNHTDEVDALEFSDPGIVGSLTDGTPESFTEKQTKRYGSFHVTVAPDVAEGRYEVRAHGRFGISNPRSIIISKATQPNVPAQSVPDSATPLTPGTLQFNQAVSQSRNYYSLPVVAGNEYLIRLTTHAIDSRILPSLSLVNPKGQTIRSVIGTDHSDLTHVFVAQETGPLTIVVHDALFRGGADYGYGLQVTESIDTVAIDGQSAIHPMSISVPSIQPQTVAESDAAVTLVVPGSIESTFDTPTDHDEYICNLKKATPVTIEVVSERLGQPTDVRFVVDRAVDDAAGGRTWQRVATGEDGHNVSDSVMRLATNDPQLNFTPPEDGDYRITVSDMDTGRSLGDIQRYQLSIGPPVNDWQLLAYRVYPHKDSNTARPAGSNLMRGDAMTIRVFAIRNQMSAPIKVTAANLPPGLSCRPAWIGSNQNQTDLIITASPEATTQWSAIEVRGEKDPGGQAPENRIAKVACVVWEQDGYRPTAHTRLTDNLVIASTALDVFPVTIDAASAEPMVTAKGTQVKVPVKVQRQEGSKDAIILRAKNLPPGVNAGDLTIPADKSEAEWNVDVTGNAATGTYTFWGQGETKVKFAVNPQSLARATERRDELKALRADESRADQHAEIDKAITESEKTIETLKKQTAARDFTVYVPSTLITLVVQ